MRRSVARVARSAEGAPFRCASSMGSTGKGATQLPANTRSYLLDRTREHPTLSALRASTIGQQGEQMQISPEQGSLMGLLAELTHSVSYLEVGTFTGYSAIAVALSLPPGGSVVTIDKDRRSMEKAKEWAQDAGVESTIEWRVGYGDEELMKIENEINDGKRGKIDYAFIDADKRGYYAYVERLARMVRQGGLLMIDNVLWYGKVADESDHDESTQAIRELNDKLHADERFSHATIPVGDGITLLRVL